MLFFTSWNQFVIDLFKLALLPFISNDISSLQYIISF
jgi:hypothetical protein